jgi:hypothetical protein
MTYTVLVRRTCQTTKQNIPKTTLFSKPEIEISYGKLKFIKLTIYTLLQNLNQVAMQKEFSVHLQRTDMEFINFIFM